MRRQSPLNTPVASVCDEVTVYLMGNFAQCDFSKRIEIPLAEPVGFGLLHLFRLVDVAPLQAMNQGAGRDIHHNHLVRATQNGVRHGFTNADARHLINRIVERFQMLDVHGGQHVDSRIQNCLHILPPFFTLRTGDICVSQFIHNDRMGDANQNGVRIHLLEYRSFIFDFAARNDGKIALLLLGSFAPVRFEIADNDILPALLSAIRLLKHLECFAHSCGKSHEYFQASAPGLLLLPICLHEQFFGRETASFFIHPRASKRPL